MRTRRVVGKKSTTTNYLLRGIPPALWRRVKIRAAQENLTLKTLLLEALEEYLKK